MKARRLFAILSLSLLSLTAAMGQAPNWVLGTPTISNVGSISVDANYAIDKPGVVYIAIWNYNVGVVLTSAQIKAAALGGPTGTLVATAVLTVNAGNINTLLQQYMGPLQSSRLHTLFIVAEGTPGGLQAAPVRFNFTTLVCPTINILTGFTQPIICINQTPVATFEVVIVNPDPNVNGILKGTQWTLDWGDGTTAAYTSTADNDIPPVGLRTHTYSTVTSCNYVFSNGIKNPCGQTRAVQYIAVVHGRDIPSDGDGVLQIVDNATGSTTINVCAGTQTIITIRDNSTWNCQNPTLPGGLTPVPNTDPRNIEWLYGRDPLGAITNTITGAVAIATLGNAPATSGRILPSPYGPTSLSQAITIPATCVAGQYFRVYLKNWNKCNWADPDYVYTSVDINVIAAPPAPTAPSRTICLGDVTTLTVTSPPVGTITWYANAGLTTVLGTGTTYTPVIGAAGVTNYWVTDQSTTGLLCMSPSTQVTLTTRETLTQPGVISGPAQVCTSSVGNVFSVVAVPPTMPIGGVTQYVWTVPAGWTITAGQGTKSITVTAGVVAGAQTISLVDQYTTAPSCASSARTFPTNLNPVATINSAAAGTVCSGLLYSYTATSATPGCTFAWTRAVVPGISNGAGAGATALISETLINTTNAAINVIYLITPTINGCTGTTFTHTVTVNPTPSIANKVTSTCSAAAFTVTPVNGADIVPAGTTYSWPLPAVTGGLTGGATGAGAANISGTLTNPTNTAQTATYTVTPLSGGCPGTTFTVTVTVNPKPTIANKVATTCTAVAFSVTPVNGADIVPAGTVYSWAAPVVTGGMTGGAAGVNQASIFGTLSNTTATAQTATYTVTPVGGGCTGLNFTVTVTVNPKAAIAAMAGSSCSAAAFTITPVNGVNGTVPAGTTYSWAAPVVTGGMTGGAAGAAQANINGTLTNPTNINQTATYTVTPLSGACGGANFTVTVTINPKATIGNKGATTCSAVGFSVTPVNGVDIIPAGTTYSWPAPVVTGGMTGGAAGAGAASITGTLTNPTNTAQTATYTVTPLSGGCTGASFTLTVTVNPVPSIGAMTATTCNSTAFTVTPVNGVNGIVPAGTTYSWPAPVVTGGMTGGAAGAAQANINGTLNNATTTTQTATYTVTPLKGVCTGANFTVTITVNPTAVITSAATKTVCSNTPLAYTATSSTAGATFAWTRAVVAGISNPAGAGATALINESLINTTAADVNCVYVITPSYGGCAGTPFNLTVTVHPQFPTAQLHDDISICNNTATNFFVTLTGGTSPYTVNYTRNAVAQGPLTPYVSGTNVSTGVLTTGSYVYALTSVTDNFGCPTQSLGTNITVTVGAALTGATLTGSGDACFGAVSTIKSVITGGAPPYTLTITGFAGSPVAGYSSGSNIALTPPSLTVGAHTYILTNVTDACTNSIAPAASYTINIYANPVANAGPDQSICGALLTTLAAVPSVGIGTWTKTSGPGTVNFSNANLATSTATVSAYGTYVLRWTEVNGGICTSFDEVTVAYAEAANAGPDQQKCGTLIATLAGNTPSAGSGLWTKTSGPGTVNFSNSASPTSTATVSAYGIYVLRWTITNGSCNSFDEVTIAYAETANAGPDQQICGALLATLAGNSASAGTGTWTKTSGPGTVNFSNANSSTSTATVSAYGTYVLRWTILNGGCSTFDEVTVAYAEAANAGPDQQICGALVATLAGNAASAGAGVWTKISGPGTVNFSNSASPTSTATVSAYGTYVLRWTITNGSCNTFDEITIAYAETANAGPDQQKCGTLIATLAANSASAGTGTWTKTSGPGTVNFSNANSATSTATVSAYGTYVLRWTIVNGSCNTFDEVTIAYAETANAGPDQQVCGALVATLAGNAASAGAGVWTKTSGPGTVNFSNSVSPTSNATVSLYGTYVLRWTITNGGCNTFDEVTVAYAEAANAGPDQQKCGTLIATLAANSASAGAGLWTKTSGPGTVNFSNSASPTSTATVSLYGTYVLRWTITNGSCNTFDEVTIAYAETANAGPDQQICGALIATLAGNAASAGTGTWTKTSGPGTVNFSNANSATSTATVSVYGTYVLRWTIVNGGCSTFDEVTVAYAEAANAGPDQTLCGTLIANLAGNAASAGAGVWTKTSGPGTVNFSNSASPTSTATVSLYGTYVLRWTITNGSCNTFDEVTIAYAETANAGPDQYKCGVLVATLAGNAASAGTGTWTKTSGPGTVNFSNANSATSTATVSVYGTYVLRWTIVNGSCNTFDEVTIAYAENANAGPDQALCSTLIATLAGNSASAGTGTWTKTSGPGTVNFSNANSATSTATVSAYGTYVLRWTIVNGSCNSFDEVTIAYEKAASAGPAQDLCNTLVATMAGNAAAVGTGTWTKVSGPGTVAFAPNANTATATATVSVYGAYVFKWTIDNGGVCSTNQDVTINYNPAGQVDQPSNQVLCNGFPTTAITFTTTNTIGTTTYAWTNSVPGIGLAASGSGNISSFTATNAGTAPVVATIVVTPTLSNGPANCVGSTKTFTITVNPTPTLSSTLTPADVCSNSLFSYPPTSATGGTTFNWTRASVAGITPAGPTSGTNNPNETLRNITSIPIAVTYQYTLAANGCSNVQNVVVNIKPEPVITAGQTTSACSGVALNYKILMDNFNNPADNVTFTWPAPVLNPISPNFTGGSARAVGSIANITDTYLNTTGALATATYTITPLKNGCSGTPVTVVITVGAQPVLNPGLNAFACSNVATGLTLSVAGGSVPATYYNVSTITIAGGLTADPGNVIIPNATAPANYLAGDKFVNTTGVNKTVTYHIQPILAPDCYGAFVDVVITIRPQPVILPGQTKTVCSEVAIGKEILLVPANTPAGTLFNWPVPVMSDLSVQGTAGVNVVADPSGTIHLNDALNNFSSAPITATYTVTPTSSFGCVGTAIPVVITVNPEPIPQPISGRDKICVTDKNIVYNVNPVAGSTFHWTVDPAVGTKTFDFNTNAILIDAAGAAGSGNITVYETNSYTCSGHTSTKAVQVYAQTAPENITGPAVVCAFSTQIYSVTSRVGSVYNWTVPGGAAIIGDPSLNSITVVFSNVGGSIQCRETNAAGCITDHNPKAVTVNPLPTATISGSTTICVGGSANLTVTFTGTGPYTFTYALNGVPQVPINTAANPYTLNVTASGSYTIVNVTDANCTNNGSGTATVLYYPQPTGIISGTATMCKGGSTTLTITLTGTSPYTFTYTDGTTPVNVVNYAPAVYTTSVSPIVNTTYTLTALTDNHSCTGVVSGSAVITVNNPPVLTLVGTNLTCNNDNTGAVDLTVTGNSPFGYSWTGPSLFTANTEDISGLAAGIYTVVVTDTKGCQSTSNITITQPNALSATVASTNIFCFGVAEGTITVSAPSGGSGSFEYSINGGTSWQASGNFTALNPGTYNVMMRDAVSTVCTKVLDAARVLTGPAVMTAAVAKTDVDCNGANNGTITVSAPSGGFGTYQYTVNGGTTWQGSGSFTGLGPATYNVKMRDAAHPTCEVTLNGAVVITEPVVLSATVTRTNITCFGAADGTISVTAPAGGHGTYEYSINGGSSWQATGNFVGLTPGNYNVQIRDAAYITCLKVLNAALAVTQPAVLNGTITTTAVTCNGANDGIIAVTAPTGGYGTYEYTINGGTTWQALGNFAGLAPGSYDVRIRDAANTACVVILNNGVSITEPSVLNGNVVISNITCFGANDGVINITSPSGGYGTYEYTINGGGAWQASGNFSGLTAGIYDVRIRDKAHTACVKVLNAAATITEPAVLNASVVKTNVTCNSAADGTITISSPTGGYGTYQYTINGGASWQGSGNFINLSPGSYNVRIRDAANTSCVIVLNPALVITEPAVLSATVAKTNVTCFSAADGTITINGAAGGYGTYEYTVNGGSTWQVSNSFAALIPGFYNVKIRDAANTACIITLNGSLSITEPGALNATVAKTNVTCNSANDGTITISSPTGGYGTYQYSINGGTTWQASGSFTALTPASYDVRIRDGVQTTCVITLNAALVITEPAALSATVSSSNVTCFGANNGTISITGVAGGYGTYEYTINGGTTWVGLGSFTNLAPATYDVRIRDAAHTGCTLTLNGALVITQPAVLSAAVARTNVTCFGAADGTITISSPLGGYGTYEYTINGGGSWQASGSFTALGPGNYNVQIRDAAHPTCVIVLNNALTITQPSVLNAVVTPTMVTCNGANDGIIAITVPTGGYGTYEYSINGGTTWQASGTFSALSPASYDVRIRDAVNTGCVIILNSTLAITEPAVISANLTSTNVTCFGANDATITISSPTGGYGTYEYTINGGTTWQTSASYSGLTPATYNVQIRDKAHTGCVKVLNAALVLTQPAVLNASVTSTNVTCNGAGNGTITVSSPTGGYGTYQYTVNGGASWQGSGNFTSLSPGTYNVRIRDAAHIACEIVLNPALVITQPAVLSATVAKTNVNCFGAADGTITITSPLGGYGTYEYTISGGTTWQASGNFTALTPGFYNVQIRDAANTSCIVTLNGSLQITEPAILAAVVARTNVTCNGANDGTITISSPTGGYGTYEYTINGGGSWQASGNFASLAPGNYNIEIRDAAHTGCVIVLNAALAITEPAVLNATVASTNVTCFGAANGTITITSPTGGYGTYQYTVNGGTSWQGSGTFTNLAPASYNVKIRDAANTACVITLNGTLVITQPAVLSATVNKTNVTCFGAADGTITISSPLGGYGTYEYSVNGGGSWQPSGNFINLSPGSYNVQIRDAANTSCVIVLNNSLSVTQPAVLNAVVTPTMVTCNGANDGIITITLPTGGYGTYQYTINGGTTWQASGTFSGLAPATYDVRIRDAANAACVISLNPTLVITEPAVLNATVASTNVTCFGANDGTITISAPTGGYGTYEYTINGGGAWQLTGNFSALAPGSYDVRIRDKAHTGCVIVLNAALAITQPAVLSAAVAGTNVTCNGSNDGTISITAPAGGYGTYQYTINGGATWQSSGSFTNLAPATYNVKIRDAAHVACEIILNGALVITQPAKLTATVASTNVTCFGANDGTITLSAPAGGYGTYEYSVNGGTSWQASGNFAALAPGFYNVQIRDAANTGCVVILNGSLRITEPSVLSAFVSSTNVTCNGANDGTITINSPTGGYGTYQYTINGGGAWQASGNFTSLAPGSYDVEIRDAAHTGCVIVLNAALAITQPNILSATVTPTNVTCFGANDGMISITSPTGGYGTYQYSANGGTTWQGSGTFTSLAPASYNVQIRDASHTGCIVTLNAALLITQPTALTATITSTNVTCFGGNDGTITISSPAGGYGTYEYSINGGGSWQASGNFTTLSPGSYDIMIRDAAHTGCVIVLNAAYAVTQPPILSATVTKTDVTCNGANNGTITISSPGGGYGTYQYTINGGTSWQASGNFTGLVPGTYNVRIRDAANTACSVILYPNLTVNEPLVLTMTSTGNFSLSCFGDMTGSGTFYAAGGTLPYSFNLISNTTGGVLAAPGFNSQSFFAAGAGTITVGVTDSKGCTAQATIIISQPGLLTPGSVGTDQVLCNGDNPALLTQVTAPTGGPAAYVYQWQYATNVGGPFINIAGANASTYTPPAGATTTLYYRRMVTSGSCTPVYSNVIEILVNPKPVGILTGGETICPAQTSILKVNLPIGTGPFELDIQNYPGLTITGYVSDADINVTPAVTTIYKILRIKDANGCQVTSPSANIMGSATVTVRDLPAVTVSPVNKTTCEFGMVTFNVTATGSDLTYQWYVNEGAGFIPVVDGGIYFGGQTSSLMLFGTTRDMNNYIYHVVVTGCSTNVTSGDAILTVNTSPEILNQPKDSTICQGANATFSVNAQGTGLTYQWQVRQGASFVNVVDGGNYAGATTSTLSITGAPGTLNNSIYRVKLSGTCGVPVYSNFVVLRVNVAPTVTLNPLAKSVCDLGGPVYFSGNGSGMIDSLRWQVFSGGIWTDIYDDAIYSGTTSQQLALVNVPVGYNGNQYRLALKAACASSYTNPATLTVHSNPVVDFTAVNPINACGGVPIVINGNPTGGSGTYTQHTWTGDVGPLSNYFIQSPTFSSQIAGTYDLNYKVKDSNGCTANNNVQVVVDAPDATFTTDANQGCTPLIVNFTKDMTGLAKFWWDFGDGSPKDSINANPTHTFTNLTPSSIEYHDVVLKVRSAGGCYDTFTTTVTVFPQIDASFTSNKTVVCSGGSIIFTGISGAAKYFWDYGDGASGYATNVATHLYTNLTTAPEVLTVTLTTTSFYSCTNSQTMNITVMPVPLPGFTANPVSQIFIAGGNPVAFTNTTNAGTWTWAWKFGDGGTSAAQDPSHTYTGIGSYNVTLTVSNTNCTDSIMHQITVTPIPPVANFDSVPSACAPLNVNFNNTSLHTDVPGTKFFWDFGDGGSSTAKGPSYTYFSPSPYPYRITLTVTGPYGDQSVKSQLVNAYQSPLANFSVTPTNVFVNDEKVRFFNLTQFGDYYVWDFGDGDTSHVEQPFHKYMTEGVYDVTLHAYSSNGCMDSYTLSPGVTVEPAGVLRFSTVFTPNKTGPIDLTSLPTGGEQIDQFFFPPIREKVLDYKLQIFNRWGTLIFESRNINVPWNGYYKGKLCKQGVYVWFVEGKYANGKPFKKTGDVTLLQ